MQQTWAWRPGRLVASASWASDTDRYSSCWLSSKSGSPYSASCSASDSTLSRLFLVLIGAHSCTVPVAAGQPTREQLLSSLVFLAQHDILRTDNLLAGKLILPFLGEAACHCVVQRRWPGEIIPGSS